MNIAACMKRHVVSIPASTTIREAAALFVKKHIGLLPVVDRNDKPVGVIGIRDLLKLEMPDFVNFVMDVDFVHDFGAVEDAGPPALMLQQSLRAISVVSKDGKSFLAPGLHGIKISL
ncbi:CBS domain-containing protein [Chloroflexi bacterium CFX5]|nr:CBS domain-containing protein [Chloroflexi bacterium CFX5]